MGVFYIQLPLQNKWWRNPHKHVSKNKDTLITRNWVINSYSGSSLQLTSIPLYLASS